MANINGLKKTFLLDIGVSEGTIAWRAYLDSQGFSGNSLVDDTKALLVDAGHWTGNMSESLVALYTFGGAITIESLFASGQKGFWFTPSDVSTLYQDAVAIGSLFASGQKGFWFTPSDVSTLYQDSSSIWDPSTLFKDGQKSFWYTPSDTALLYQESDSVWDPATLFADGQEGVWYTPSDVSNLYKSDTP